MARLQLTLLGGFEARIAPGQPLDIATRKTQALLAYLALPTGRAHSRDKLAGLLWSDRGDEQARNSLRQAIAELGRVLAGVEPSLLVKGRDTLALDPQAVEVDAMAFEQLAASEAAGDLRHAAGLYASELLDGFAVRDAAFEDWLRDERQRYRELVIAVLKKLARHETGPDAVAVAQRLVTLAPLQEDGHRTLMRLHAEADDIGAALLQYETCRDRLQRELGIQPSPETEALHKQIRGLPGSQHGSRRFPSAIEAHESPLPKELAKPSIAVLPFRNLSGDPNQQYFSDGITEDIITELSRFRGFSVIARHSAFMFRDSPVDVVEVGRKLNVQYIASGSVQRTDDRLRINAWLVDASSGRELWSDRYNQQPADIFAVQDDLTRVIAGTLSARVESAGATLARRKRPEDLAAYDYSLRGRELYNRMDEKTGPQARELLHKAIDLDPELAQAHAHLAASYLFDWSEFASRAALDQAYQLARRAVDLDGDDGHSHSILAGICLYRRNFDQAQYHSDRALALNPNDYHIATMMGLMRVYGGRPAEAVEWLKRGLRLNPFPPEGHACIRGMALYVAKRYPEAIVDLTSATHWGAWDTVYRAACYSELGRSEEARAEVALFMDKRPGLSPLDYARNEPFKNAADLDQLLDGVRRAGLPE